MAMTTWRVCFEGGELYLIKPLQKMKYNLDNLTKT